MPDEPLLVHLQSLTDFAHDLGTHLAGLTDPAGRLAGMAGHPPSSGNFVEAFTLVARHRAVVAETQTALDQAKQAMTFAQEVTNTVAEAYLQSEKSSAANYTNIRTQR